MSIREKVVDIREGREPVGVGGAITTLLLAVIAVVNAFGPRFSLELSQAEVGALVGFAAAIEVAITAWQRGNAWPDERVQNEFLDAEHVIHGD